MTAQISSAGQLPERTSVPWRRPADHQTLRRSALGWTLTTTMQAVPFVCGAGLVVYAQPLLIPLALILLAHAWAIPELYAWRGAGVLRERQPRGGTAGNRALLMLGDLIDHRARDLHGATGLVIEQGRLGVWLLGEAGALLIRPGGRRVNAYCVRVPEADLPPADRIAHLLLALRCDESGFATVANLAFSGACWRLRRRLAGRQRAALAAARALARKDRAQQR